MASCGVPMLRCHVLMSDATFKCVNFRIILLYFVRVRMGKADVTDPAATGSGNCDTDDTELG